MLTLDSPELSIVGNIISEVAKDKKIQAIKLIRELTDCDLLSAKKFVDQYCIQGEELKKLQQEIAELKEQLFNSQREASHYFEQDQTNLKRLLETYDTTNFLKSIIFQYDEFNSESLHKAIIAHKATKGNQNV